MSSIYQHEIIDTALTSGQLPQGELPARYEPLFRAYYELVEKRGTDETPALLQNLIDILARDFSNFPDSDYRARAQEVIGMVMAERTMFKTLVQSERDAIEDVLINIGMMRALVRSYGIRGPADVFVGWANRITPYLAFV